MSRPDADTIIKIKELLADAPCTCTDAETGIGCFPEHRQGNSNCFRNMADELLKAITVDSGK